jgi:FkbM family methyltransferase
LRSRERRFVDEYLVDFSATRAATRIGCDEETARSAGAELLKTPEVGHAISERMMEEVRPHLNLIGVLVSALGSPSRMGQLARAVVKAVARKNGYEFRRIEPSDVYGHSKILEADLGQAGTELIHAYHKGHCFFCYGRGPATHRIATGGEWDAHLKRMLFECARRVEGGTVVEVGANVGASFIPVCARLPRFQFVLFEPIPQFFEVLRMNRDSFQADNVKLDSRAVSDGSSDAMLLLYDDSSGGIATGEGSLGRYHSLVVSATSLDREFPEEKVVLLKIDVDGFEWDVLRGGEKLIRRSKPDILLEFQPILMKLRRVEPATLLEFMADCGLDAFDVFTAQGEFLETTQDQRRVVQLAERQKAPYRYVDIRARTRDA